MKKYMLVDDNSFSLSFTEELLSQVFQDEEVEFVQVDNGDEAVKQFAESAPGEFAAIFMDIIMPGKTGLVILREMRSLEREDAKTVPVIMVSALAEDNNAIQPEERAMITDFIQKPLSVEKFQNALRKINEL